MGTHPIFESDFDCLTDFHSTKKWTFSNAQIGIGLVGILSDYSRA